MPTTTLLLNGFSIIGDPQTNSNASKGGELMIHDGTAVFDYDDIVVFTVEGANADGTLTGNSVITQVTVYDNASDYFFDVPKYTYDALPGGGADIETGRNNMGDRYLEFDASSLTSTDAGAPILGDMAVVAGVDILGTLATQNGPLKVPTTEDIDVDGDGIIDPNEQGDATFSSDLNLLAVICFARGTLIETPDGPRPVESLRQGDMVTTLDAGPQPIRWIGGRHCDARGVHAPIRFRRGAIGNVRDLWVSPNHRMLIAGPQQELMFGEPEVLVAAKHLVNGTSIQQVPRARIEYFHFLCDAHQIVFAEGCPAESLYPGVEAIGSITDDAREEIITLFPEIETMDVQMDLSRYTLRSYEADTLRLAG